MINNKKGISPLIATVLLIGFTIVLAALVFQWGGQLFKSIQTQTGCESQGRISCTSNVAITLGNVVFTTSTNSITQLIINNGVSSKPITTFMIQIEKNDGTIKTQPITLTNALAAGDSLDLGATPISFGASPILGTDIKAIHVIPGFTQQISDGSTCPIICQEQKTSVLAGNGGKLTIV